MLDSCKDDRTSDFSQDTWLSLLGLLMPSEFFVTIDHFPIWRRHLAWAKTDGDDLQKHTTQQFSTNMVFMSLLLGAELNVLFNSSGLTTDMRKAMQNEEYHELKYWIGVVILVSVFVTIFALVGTFTAWRMVSAVSDSNAHCILRSSIGQYVTHLPSRLIVAALYSFLLWMILFLVDMLSGPLCFVFFAMITILFAQIIISYSSFGRLIIHTGAMGKKQILDPKFEKSLLPSGLHASLLIKATGQVYRRTSVTSQYRSSAGRKSTSGKKSRRNSSASRGSSADSRRQRQQHSLHESGILTADDEQLIMKTAESLSLRSQSSTNITASAQTISPSPTKHELDTSMDFSASTTSEDTDDVSLILDDIKGSDDRDEVDEKGSATSDVTNDWNKSDVPFASHWESPFQRRRAVSGKLSSSAMHRRTSVKLMEEWQNESDCRGVYNIPPPPELPLDDSDDESYDSGVFMPRASVLNRTRNMLSLRNLANEAIIRSPSISENDALPSASEVPSIPQNSFSAGFFTPMANIVKLMSDRRENPSPESSSSSDLNRSESKRVNFAPLVHIGIDTKKETIEGDCESQCLLSNNVPHYSSSGAVPS